MTDHEPITVTIVGLARAAQAAGWEADDLAFKAKGEGVLIDANDPAMAAAFGISPYYVPQAWLDGVERPDEEEPE